MLQEYPAIQAELKQREISREKQANRETIVYDNGQEITRRKETVENPTNVQRITGRPTSEIVLASTADRRSGRLDQDAAWGSHSNFGGEKQGYPELESLVETAKRFYGSRFKPHLPPILTDLPAILFGQTPLPPWAVLHPIILGEIIIHSIFPFERVQGVKLSKAESYFRAKGLIVEPEMVSKGCDGFVACISPARYSHGSPEGFPSYVDIRFFNPRILSSTPKVEHPWPHIPNPDTTLFEFGLGPGLQFGRRKEPDIMFISTFPYAAEKFNAIDKIDLETIDRERKNGFYVKVDRSLVELIARLAPLPIEQSDCGKELGYPQLNQAYEDLCMKAHQRDEIIRTLKKEERATIAFLNDPESWRATTDLTRATAACKSNELLIVRNVMRKEQLAPGGEALTAETSVAILPRSMADGVRRLVELSDDDREAVGLDKAKQTVYQLVVKEREAA